MKAYSMDLRLRVLQDCGAGMKTLAVAKKYRVSTAWVRRLKQRRRETGQIAPRPQRYGPRPGWKTYGEQLRQALEQNPEATLAELKEQLQLGVSLLPARFKTIARPINLLLED